jgi:ABC-type branched-subunit amino acid transport system substrate-binding protein
MVTVPVAGRQEGDRLGAGGLIPIARQYPGAREFVEAHHREYPGVDLSFHTAAGYAGCQVLTEAVKRAGSVDRERVRGAILKLDFNTVFGAFYERLITQEHVDLVLGPYGSPNVEAVASVVEKHRMPTMSPSGGTTSIFKKGRKFIFQVISPAEVYLEGLIDMAARRGLKTVGVLYEDTLLTQAIAQGTLALAKKRGPRWSSPRPIREG